MIEPKPERRRCHATTEVWSRVTGFYRPVRDWNPGKQCEFFERRTYRADAAEPAAKEEKS